MESRIALFLLIAGLNVLGAGTVTAQTTAQSPAASALLDKELKERELAYQLAPIKSAQELEIYLAENRADASPLQKLSPGARQRFLESLMFTDRGLASFDTQDLQVELTASEAYRLLQLFGVQRSISSIPNLRIVDEADAAVIMAKPTMSIEPRIDHHNYWCESKASCSYSTNKICIGDNC